MKRVIVASILGMAATVGTVATSSAQGTIAFDTYTTGLALVTFNTASTGQSGGVGSTFHAALYYVLGNSTGNADPSGTALPSVVAPALSLYAQATTGNPYPTPFFNGAYAGLFLGPNATINEYASGSVSFMVIAYNGADYASSTIRGHSTVFTEASLATGNTTPSPFTGFTAFQVFTVPIPEPSTIALAGLGMASLLFIRRRK